ncbi:MAG TPA: hypothetical protein VKR55_16770 [Bradyrhizobium sp.]|nr:hypothetical protein [Bradyrhizobium sp.]HLZ03788.1 hypothetical protein [Bradyrhizobium sp.]
MRRVDVAALAARKHPVSSAGRDLASVQLVCLGLTLALVTLACRIYSVW